MSIHCKCGRKFRDVRAYADHVTALGWLPEHLRKRVDHGRHKH